MSLKTGTLGTLVTLALLVGACGSDGGEATTTTAAAATTAAPFTTTTAPTSSSTSVPTTSSTAPEAEGIAVYFLLEELEADAGGPFLVPVFREIQAGFDIPMAAMEVLVDGPDDGETEGIPSISTAIPDGSSVLGVIVEDGLARVDLSDEFDDGGGSASMFARLAQVVYTLTRIDGVDQVEFLIAGEPVEVFSSEGIEIDGPQERSDYYELLPPIFVDTPAWGEPVTSPVAVSGLSNVFEAVSQVMLADDDGAPLFEDSVMATCGTGCWGEWQVDVPYEVDRDQFGALIVWENSAEDGSRINIREYPVQMR
jgi:spore germination protein GerM